MNKHYKINSKITTILTPNIKIKDITDKNSLQADKLRVKLDFDVKNEPFKITAGENIIPARVMDWETTQALLDNKIIYVIEEMNENKKNVEVINEIVKDSKKLKL